MLYAVGAYSAWGLFPLYWKALKHVEPLQILAHRVLWSLVFAAALVAAAGRFAEIRTALGNRRTVVTLLGSTSLIGLNWYLFIWAVNTGHVLEPSLGYFINPLVNVLLGMVFLGERLRPVQWFCTLLASAGVISLAWAQATFPWIALTLAGSFGLYGLLRKTAQLESLTGLMLEAALLAPLALVFLFTREVQGTGVFGHADGLTHALLIIAGVVTAGPLLWFAHAARLLPLSLLGFFQYLAPTGQFLLAVFVYDEAFTHSHAVAFGCIWTALGVYSADAALRRRVAR